MRFTSIVPAMLAGAAVAMPFDVDHLDLMIRQIPVRECSKQTGGLHLLVLGGANSDNPYEQGYLGSLAGKILAKIPGSSNASVPYNKEFVPGSNPPKLMPGAISDGMAKLKQYTVQYHQSCPQTKMAIIGYSSGGVISMNDLCYGGNGQGTDQINPKLAGNTIIGQVMYGEETRAPGQPWNLGTCTQGHGTAERSNSAACTASGYGQQLQSYCDSGDPDCCVGQGTPNKNIHFSYPAKYDTAATNYIYSQWQKHKNDVSYTG